MTHLIMTYVTVTYSYEGIKESGKKVEGKETKSFFTPFSADFEIHEEIKQTLRNQLIERGIYQAKININRLIT